MMYEPVSGPPSMRILASKQASCLCQTSPLRALKDCDVHATCFREILCP